jgi:hypothetical protein
MVETQAITLTIRPMSEIAIYRNQRRMLIQNTL